MNEVEKTVEVCFTPAVYDKFHKDDNIVVVVDILRATSAICTAFMNGVEKIIPVGTLEEAKKYKSMGYLVAAERDGLVRDFADFGNSPFNFTMDTVKNKQIVYSTTNGTNAIKLASKSYQVIIGAYLNLRAVSDYLIKQNHDVLVLCAGWKDKFSLEDSVFAGALSELLLGSNRYTTTCDSALASIDLWKIAKNDLMQYIDKVAQRSRLRKNGLDDVIEYCHTPDQTEVIPVLSGDFIIEAGNHNKD